MRVPDALARITNSFKERFGTVHLMRVPDALARITNMIKERFGTVP